MEIACDLFEKEFGYDTVKISKALKYHGNKSIIKTFAFDSDTTLKINDVKEILVKGTPKAYLNSFRDQSVIGCVFSIFIGILIFALIGIYTVFSEIF
ncbi:MAG: hypothetical protein K0R71_5 [Bacillales bacterium]|jgi:hypothetical protein|nr:hypothetical protein [Bacillales bacterium]